MEQKLFHEHKNEELFIAKTNLISLTIDEYLQLNLSEINDILICENCSALYSAK